MAGEASVRTRLGAYVVALVVVFGASFGIGRVVVPDGAGQRWQERIESDHHTGTDASQEAEDHDEH
ncbi:MAG: hypothetical protein M9952_09980 [Microthrixaceae bacterium]|nr:hypothetical protein [Microthrixaceae bacterium]HPB46769.1 hypothetical protein [Microthrixaceae bacterium]